MKRLLAAGVVALSLHAPAQPFVAPVPPPAGLAQRPGESLPLEMALTDSDGARVRLGDFFGDRRPVLLVLGYYRCPQLCGLVMHGVLEALHDSRAGAVRVVAVSIDPQDTPATARARRERDLDYARFLTPGEAPLPDLHLLVASAADSARLARRVGFSYTASAGPARFAHPAAVLVVTPQGRVSRYLMGVGYDAAELRTALADASGGRIGGLSDRIALLCAHFDPRWGRYSDTILDALRVAGVAGALALGAWCWRRRTPPPQEPR